MTAPAQEVTQLRWLGGKGHQTALEKLTSLVYNELHRLAKQY